MLSAVRRVDAIAAHLVEPREVAADAKHGFSLAEIV